MNHSFCPAAFQSGVSGKTPGTGFCDEISGCAADSLLCRHCGRIAVDGETTILSDILCTAEAEDDPPEFAEEEEE